MNSRRAAFAIGFAAAASAAVQGFGYWIVRNDILAAGSGSGIPVLTVVLVAVGVIAGLTTRGYRYSIGTWAGALAGWAVAFQVNYTVFPGGPAPDSSPAASVLLVAVFTVPVAGGAHVLGVWLGNHSWRRSSRSQADARDT
jgi:hypothetical protein